MENLLATGDDLKKKIANLAASGAITKDLAAWADEVRITGNEAAHEMGPVSVEDAKDSLFFLDSFLEAVYSVPERHRRRRAERGGFKAFPRATAVWQALGGAVCEGCEKVATRGGP